MASFVGKSDLYVDHIDGDKTNNNLSNLRYVTNSENLTFRNTDKKYKSKHPYVYFDNLRNQNLFNTINHFEELADKFGVTKW
jgi:hypothetical protein